MVVDFSIIQMYPCFAEFYLTDKASVGIELSSERTRGDVFFLLESDVVSCTESYSIIHINCQAGL